MHVRYVLYLFRCQYVLGCPWVVFRLFLMELAVIIAQVLYGIDWCDNQLGILGT